MSSLLDTRTSAVEPAPWRFWFVTERKIRALRGYASSAFITSIANPVVYLLALGVGLGSLVPEGGAPWRGGVRGGLGASQAAGGVVARLSVSTRIRALRGT